MKTIRSFSFLAAGILATVALSPAQAVELQQKWQAGQALDYDLSMNGTANVKLPASAKIFFAGVPLEIELAGKGSARLNTLEVSPTGDGTVFVDLPKFDLNGSTFGQKALLELRDGETRILINGKPIATPKPDPKKPMPKYALVIGKDGRIKSVKELDKNGKLKPTVASATATGLRKIADEETVAPAEAIDQGAFITSVILRALPTLWPQRDVQPGETWQTTLPLPPAFARDAATAQQAAPLSEWNMTLKGQEVVDGVSLWRVGIAGGIQVDGQNLAAPKTPQKGENPVPALENLSQRVDGDLWIDADKGQVVRGDMVIDARGQSNSVDSTGRKGESAWADFTGTFALRLRDAK